MEERHHIHGGYTPDEERAPITILLVDDHAITREGLWALLETDPNLRVIGEAANGLAALERTAALRPSIVLMDLKMPVLDGLEATRRLRAGFPTIPVVIMTGYDDDTHVAAAMQAGASGYLRKDASCELLTHTVVAVANGAIVVAAADAERLPLRRAEARAPQPYLIEQLTERERIVLQRLADGQTNKEIGDSLGYAEVTVKKYVQVILAKLQASGRTHAAITALRLGLIE